jgi:hypothetical protein
VAKIKSQGTTLHISSENADATVYASATFVKVNGLRTIGSPDGEASEIDTTDLDSAAAEFMMGVPDNGKFAAAGHAVDGDAGQAELLDARNTQQLRWVKITDSAANVAYFKAVVTRYSDIGAEVNGVRPLEASFRISGAITYV